MCYFINLKITLEGKPNEAKITEVKSALEQLAKREKITLRGDFPQWQITDGHCACDFVLQNGAVVNKTVFAIETAKNAVVKNVQFGWTWTKNADIALKPDARIERITVEDFLTSNARADLKAEIWYRMSDLSKYECGSD